MITGFYAGLMGLMLVVLIVRTAMRRRKYKVGLGDGGIPDLTQAIRVHGNFVETVPIILILMGLMELGLVRSWIVHAFGVLLILSRLAHAYGITSNPGHSLGRMAGILTGLGLLVVGAVILIFNFLGYR